jgi:hypothetical protein
VSRDTAGERDTLVETITRRVLQEVERTVVTREMAVEVRRTIADEGQR